MAGRLEAWLADADACCVVTRRRVSCPAAFLTPAPPTKAPEGDEGEAAAVTPRQAPPAALELPPLSPALSSSSRRWRRESYHGDGPLSCGTGAALAAASDARQRAAFLLRTLD